MQHGTHGNAKSGYRSLFVQTAASAVIMYFVMFVMIDSAESFYNNLNMLYMTFMMAAPMVVLMIISMRDMFPSKPVNFTLITVAAIAFFGSLGLIRTQATIGDAAFLRSMIPHHSGAILMCRNAQLSDPEVIALCTSIQRSQRQEIEQMKAILARH